MGIEDRFPFIQMECFLVVTVVTGRGWKSIGKDRGGGGKKLYLYIVKIGNFHPILTPSLSQHADLALFTQAVNWGALQWLANAYLHLWEGFTSHILCSKVSIFCQPFIWKAHSSRNFSSQSFGSSVCNFLIWNLFNNSRRGFQITSTFIYLLPYS